MRSTTPAPQRTETPDIAATGQPVDDYAPAEGAAGANANAEGEDEGEEEKKEEEEK